MTRIFPLVVVAGLLAASACTKPADQTGAVAVAKPDSSLTETIAGDAQFKTLAAGLKSTGLDGVFSGKGDYTLLAPTEAAFSALGDKALGLTKSDQTPILAAVLRGHVIPGMLTTDDIAKAIAANDGKPISMRTMGTGSVSFARNGSDFNVTADDGSTAKLAGAGMTASNGEVLPISAVLKKL